MAPWDGANPAQEKAAGRGLRATENFLVLDVHGSTEGPGFPAAGQWVLLNNLSLMRSSNLPRHLGQLSP